MLLSANFHSGNLSVKNLIHTRRTVKQTNRSQVIAREWRVLCRIELSIEHMTGKGAKEII